jgi:hypothetical protein
LTKVLSQVDPRKLAGVVLNGVEEPVDSGYYRYSTEAKAGGN